MRRLIIPLLVILISCPIALNTAMAHTDQALDQHVYGLTLHQLQSSLSLTNQQSTTIAALLKEYRQSHVQRDYATVKAERKKRRLEFVALMNSPTLDQGALESYIQTSLKRREDNQYRRIKLQHAIYQALNNAQRKAYLKRFRHIKQHPMKKSINKHHLEDIEL